MGIVGVSSPYNNILVHVTPNVIALPLQKALNDTVSHPTSTISLPPARRAGLRRHHLTACGYVPNVISPAAVCFLLYDRGLPDGSEQRRGRSLPDNKKLLATACLGQGHIAPKENSSMLFILLVYH